MAPQLEWVAPIRSLVACWSARREKAGAQPTYRLAGYAPRPPHPSPMRRGCSSTPHPGARFSEHSTTLPIGQGAAACRAGHAARRCIARCCVKPRATAREDRQDFLAAASSLATSLARHPLSDKCMSPRQELYSQQGGGGGGPRRACAIRRCWTVGTLLSAAAWRRRRGVNGPIPPPHEQTGRHAIGHPHRPTPIARANARPQYGRRCHVKTVCTPSPRRRRAGPAYGVDPCPPPRTWTFHRHSRNVSKRPLRRLRTTLLRPRYAKIASNLPKLSTRDATAGERSSRRLRHLAQASIPA